MTNVAIPGLPVPLSSHARSQKRDESREKPLRGEEPPRNQKSRRFLVAPPAPKILEILEPLAFLKGRDFRAPREPARGILEVSRKGSRAVEMTASGRAVILRYEIRYRFSIFYYYLEIYISILFGKISFI